MLLAISMWGLGSTSDSYLSPALEAISDKFKCSESLAGVTLLALGNGAPDVFSAIAAGGDSGENSDVMLAVSGLMGSGLFITTIVMGVVINAAGENKIVRVTKRYFLRDLAFLFLMCIYLLVCMLYFKKLNMVLSAGLLVMYVIFVIIVIIQSSMKVDDPEEEKEANEVIMKAAEFNKMVEFKREATRTFRNNNNN